MDCHWWVNYHFHHFILVILQQCYNNQMFAGRLHIFHRQLWYDITVRYIQQWSIAIVEHDERIVVTLFGQHNQIGEEEHVDIGFGEFLAKG